MSLSQNIGIRSRITVALTDDPDLVTTARPSALTGSTGILFRKDEELIYRTFTHVEPNKFTVNASELADLFLGFESLTEGGGGPVESTKIKRINWLMIESDNRYRLFFSDVVGIPIFEATGHNCGDTGNVTRLVWENCDFSGVRIQANSGAVRIYSVMAGG